MTKVLVVDDDATARILLRAALRQANFDVTLAVDGEDALRQFRAQPCDLVMLDVEMPDMSGYEVCTTMRAEAGDLLPIVMVTGMDDLESVQKAYDSGATDFIAKPINRALIAHRVRYLMRAHQAMLDLRNANARNAAILQALPDLLLEIGIDGRIVACHVPDTPASLEPISGSWAGQTVLDAFPQDVAEVFMTALAEAGTTGRSIGSQFELKVGAGSLWFELSLSRKAVTTGQQPHVIALLRDITARKMAERSILRLAHFDSLTGLPNRQAFLERVSREIQRADRDGTQLAVLFLDLDGFKDINDRHGHGAGDQLLQSVADRLRDCVRSSDMTSRVADETADDVEFARLGGDEFTALVVNLSCPEDALSVARRVLEQMERPFSLEDGEVALSTSIGVANFPLAGMDALTLLKHADAAMYAAKASGRGRYALYSPGPEPREPFPSDTSRKRTVSSEAR